MEENTEEKFKEDPQNPPQQNPPEKNAQSSEIENTSSTQEPLLMEVHHHAHHDHHPHGKKNWKAYIWEFLMLFLAVFCGFLAEYFLEHQIEKERGRQFIESFYEDLKIDTARISDITTLDQEKLMGLQDLGACYDAIMHDMNNAGCLIDVIRYTAINRPFMRTDRTLKQLANAGGFRLLKKEDADSILTYDAAYLNFLDFQSTVFQEAQNNVRATLNSIGNFKANAQMFKPEEGKMITIEGLKKEDITAPLLFSGDKTAINKYFNELQLYYRVMHNHIRMLENFKEQQGRLIGYLKGKYHFE